jgi:acyl-CoA thioesterase FadM
VHGGVIAATFDQVLNVANLMRGVAGPTRRLEMRYLKPTPLLVELRFEGWIERVEGNEVHTRGRLLVGDQVTVEAAGDFVQLSHERVMRLLETSPEKPRSESGSTKVVESAAARRRRFRRTGDGT